MLDDDAALGTSVVWRSFHDACASRANNRKPLAWEIRRWAESVTATSKRGGRASRNSFAAKPPMSPPPLPSKVVADLLRKAAETRSVRGPGSGQWSEALARQIERGLQEQLGTTPSWSEGETGPRRHFDTVASALLSALSWGGDNDGNGDAAMDSDNGSRRAAASETEALVDNNLPSENPQISSSSTASSTCFSTSFSISVPPSSSSSSTATTASAFDSGPSSPGQDDDGRHRRHSYREEEEDQQFSQPAPRTLFVTEASLVGLAARAVKAEAEAERLGCRLRDAIGHARASKFELAVGASELERVRSKLEDAEAEATSYKRRLEQVRVGQSAGGCCDFSPPWGVRQFSGRRRFGLLPSLKREQTKSGGRGPRNEDGVSVLGPTIPRVRRLF